MQPYGQRIRHTVRTHERRPKVKRKADFALQCWVCALRRNPAPHNQIVYETRHNVWAPCVHLTELSISFHEE